MPSIATSQELAQALREIFSQHNDKFDAEAFITTVKLLGFDAQPLRPPFASPKPLGDNHLADLSGVNLAHALETYDWQAWRPVTDDGVTISGFWCFGSEPDGPSGYELDVSGRYLQPATAQPTDKSLPRSRHS